MKIPLERCAGIIGGRLVGSSRRIVTGAAIDSRQIVEGDLFFALEGGFVDGHKFVGHAMQSGASAVVVGKELERDIPQIVLEDRADGLVKLAAWVRDDLDPLVVGITGSTGKTGVKDMLASIARPVMPTVASERSFNNDLGVPLTLVRAKVETEVVVCEMGSRGPGHIARLCHYARPHIGVVTNVGVTHFEQFGSREAIAAAKTELIESLPEGGAAVLNADDAYVAAMAESTKAEVITVGLNNPAMIRAGQVRFDGLGRPTFQIEGELGVGWLHVPIAGIHQVSNALVACGAAFALGLSLDQCKEGLERSSASPWRMDVRVEQGVVFVNDAYNANPDSVASALTTCAKMAERGGELVAVLGYMAELGDIEEAEHRRVGNLAAALATRLVVVGKNAAPIAESAREAGLTQVRLVDDGEEALGAIGALKPKDVLLVKGSRVAGLESLAEKAASLTASGKSIS